MTDVALAETQPQPEHGASEGVVSRVWTYGQTLRTARQLTGVLNTARIACDKLMGTGLTREYEFELDDEPAFCHPFLLTTARSDLLSYHEIIKEGAYDLPEELAGEIDGMPIVDIGAFIGMSAAYFASRYRQSPVMAIEPNPRNYQFLSRNAERYGAQIQSHYAAFSLDKGPIGMMRHKPYNSHMSNIYSTEYPPCDNGSGPHAITPEDIVASLGANGRIGLLKVDIEGAEKKLFGSLAIDPLLKRTDLLLIETHEMFEVSRGSIQIVNAAAIRNGLALADLSNAHTTVYARMQVG